MPKSLDLSGKLLLAALSDDAHRARALRVIRQVAREIAGNANHAAPRLEISRRTLAYLLAEDAEVRAHFERERTRQAAREAAQARRRAMQALHSADS